MTAITGELDFLKTYSKNLENKHLSMWAVGDIDEKFYFVSIRKNSAKFEKLQFFFFLLYQLPDLVFALQHKVGPRTRSQ